MVDRIFMLGGNAELQLSLMSGVPQDRFQVGNQPFIVVKDWDLLTLAQQTSILNLLTPLGFQATN